MSERDYSKSFTGNSVRLPTNTARNQLQRCMQCMQCPRGISLSYRIEMHASTRMRGDVSECNSSAECTRLHLTSLHLRVKKLKRAAHILRASTAVSNATQTRHSTTTNQRQRFRAPPSTSLACRRRCQRTHTRTQTFHFLDNFQTLDINMHCTVQYSNSMARVTRVRPTESTPLPHRIDRFNPVDFQIFPLCQYSVVD